VDPQSEALCFRLRMTKGLSVEDDKGVCHSRENGNPVRIDPQSEALCFRLRMTKGVSFPPPFRHSRENGNPVRMDPQSEALRFRLRMTPGQSVEDDKGCVIPAPLPSFPRKRESRLNGSPIRSASLSVEDDTGAVG